MEVAAPYEFRPYVKEDLNFISNSWAESFFKGNEHHNTISIDAFHKIHRPKREALFQNPNVAIIVCCAKETPSLIMGWLASEKIENTLTLHYVYVKQAFKAERIATNLIEKTFGRADIIPFTHKTEKAARILKHGKYPQLKYMPYLF